MRALTRSRSSHSRLRVRRGPVRLRFGVRWRGWRSSRRAQRIKASGDGRPVRAGPRRQRVGADQWHGRHVSRADLRSGSAKYAATRRASTTSRRDRGPASAACWPMPCFRRFGPADEGRPDGIRPESALPHRARRRRAGLQPARCRRTRVLVPCWPTSSWARSEVERSGLMKLNAGVKLPATDITVVHARRIGTTFVFADLGRSPEFRRPSASMPR